MNNGKRKQFTRRDFLKFIGILSASAFYYWLRPPLKNMNMTRPATLGTTFSQLQCKYLGLDYKEAYQEISALGFNTIRLCAYWNEIEPTKGVFDFTILDWLIETSQKYPAKIVLAVGMKSPRWPEFHFPKWIDESYNTSQTSRPLDNDSGLADRALNFIDKVVEHTCGIPNIQYWQIENEPLNKPEVASGRFLSSDFLQKEINLVKPKIDPSQKIMLTNAISLIPIDFGHDERAFEDSCSLADTIGLNIYTKVPISSKFYLQPFPAYWRKVAKWQQRLSRLKKEAWVAEAQAEPWEWKKLTATEKLQFPSTSPDKAVQLVTELTQIGYSSVLLWGCEYWYWHKKQNSNVWLDAITNLMRPGRGITFEVHNG